jgi:cytoskeleton protein RodZ
MDVGATLQSARERRGLSLDELARRTKISVRVLRAIESNAFDTLPQGIFIRGFLRTYAQEVGLDPAAMVEQYLADAAATDDVESPREKSDSSGAHPVFATRSAGFDSSADSGSEAGKAIAIALVSLGFVAYLSLGTSFDSDADQIVAADPATPSTGPERPAVLLASDPAVPVATTGGVLDIELRPTGPCWVEAFVDGTRFVYRLMQAGERVTLTTRDTLTLRVGNPAAFSFTVNGRPGRLPGRPGEPITIRLDTENFTDFLVP